MNLCVLCHESNDVSHVILLTDKVGRVEIRGCKACVDVLYKKIHYTVGKEKMSSEKLLGLYGYDVAEMVLVKAYK